MKRMNNVNILWVIFFLYVVIDQWVHWPNDDIKKKIKEIEYLADSIMVDAQFRHVQVLGRDSILLQRIEDRSQALQGMIERRGYYDWEDKQYQDSLKKSWEKQDSLDQSLLYW